MKNLYYVLFISGMLSAVGAVAQPQTYVLVHGAWGGGWSFKKTDSLLRTMGNEVYRPTLTGLGERVHLASEAVDLETHIKDVINVILFENLHNVVLVGHSYGGMVVTGVADSLPERIGKLIYLDAFVPDDGQSAFSARGSDNQGRGMRTENGLIPPFGKKEGLPRDVPHPAKTFSQPIRLKNPVRLKLPTTYILTYEGDNPEKDTFAPFAAKAKQMGWKTINMQADHNPQMTMPQVLAELLEEEGRAH
ncbi:Alpha/beta hydrolase family protein [Parapedobacter composti]|uniref:Alpha/beta hydrolase family protein n=1 Tax=Parapedobacter composti TaxID=623281 RepID=A0A1I1E2W2_9SPHI|nr:alpha/beta hydrolase [Parapedobacter composti]SFB81022.1 Alpha/beta hydrolase family protein [Parapedobacter composti]